ncbi:MAG: hypothetical protein LLG37_11055, partial [Spirochaetia bacterium]|nr:hypothetical protein [Spirochaetia bacterium]
KRSTVFVISDFYDPRDFRDSLKILKHRHDVIAVVLRDGRDYDVPDIGMVPFFDPEMKQTIWVDTADRAAAQRLKRDSEAADKKLQKMFKTTGVDFITLNCGEPYIKTITSFFRQRTRRRFR